MFNQLIKHNMHLTEDSNYIILNTGGYSRSFYTFIVQKFNKVHFLTLEELKYKVLTTEDYLFIVADEKLSFFTNKVKEQCSISIHSYWELLAFFSKQFFSEIIIKTNKPLILIHLPYHAGYRKTYRYIIRAVITAGYQPYLCSLNQLDDSLEQTYPFILLQNLFELACLMPQCKLLISDNGLPLIPEAQCSTPRLYIPHAIISLYDRNVELKLNEQQLIPIFKDGVLSIFTDLFLPSQAVYRLFSYFNNKPSRFLHKGGYLNVEHAIAEINIDPNVQAILYSPGAIPKNNPHADLGMSFPTQSIQIIQQLLAAFPTRKIIFRPHPLSNQTPEFAEARIKIEKLFINEKNFIFDKKQTHTWACSQSALIISDASSSAMTFALSTLRPAIFYLTKKINQELIIGNKVFKGIRGQLFPVVINDINKLVEEVQQALTTPQKYKKELLKLRSEEFFNVGQVENKLTNVIVEIIKRSEKKREGNVPI